jgi:hypothetical protein
MGLGGMGQPGLGAPAGGVGMPPAGAAGTLGGQAGGGQPWTTPWNPRANLEQQSAGGLAGSGGQGGSFGIIGQRGPNPGETGTLGAQGAGSGSGSGNWYGSTAPGAAIGGSAPAGARLPPPAGGKGGF